MFVFGPEDEPADIEATVASVFLQDEEWQFTSSRWCVMFKPGEYAVSIPVGYYTQVMGLGFNASDVVLANLSSPQAGPTAVNTVWRSAENLRTQGELVWATSQGSPLRRIEAESLRLHEDFALATGGFLSDTIVEEFVDFGSQQQYCIANTSAASASGVAWNLVSVNSRLGKLEASCSQQKAVLDIHGESRREHKPYLVWLPEGDEYKVMVDGRLEDFVVLNASSPAILPSSVTVLTPGIYEMPLVLYDDSVIIGLGYATIRGGLQVAGGSVRVAAVLIESSGVEWLGNSGRAWDLFVRVGNFGTPPEPIDVMLGVAGNDFVGEDIWLWRADHDATGITPPGSNAVRDGLHVSGDDVFFIGLAVEHAMHYQVLWTGARGTVNFFQTELPYDAPHNFTQPGYVVSGEDHQAYGVGVYSKFQDNDVQLPTAISAVEGSFFHSPFSVWLDGQGSILHILNDLGEAVTRDNQVQHLCGPNFVAHDSHHDSQGHVSLETVLRVIVPTLAVVAAAGVVVALLYATTIREVDDLGRPPPPPPQRQPELQQGCELTVALLDGAPFATDAHQGLGSAHSASSQAFSTVACSSSFDDFLQ